VAEIVRENSIRARAMAHIFRMTRARPAPGVLPFADEADKGVRSGINEVDCVIRAVRQVIFLRTVVDPTDIKAVGAIIYGGTFNQRKVTCLSQGHGGEQGGDQQGRCQYFHSKLLPLIGHQIILPGKSSLRHLSHQIPENYRKEIFTVPFAMATSDRGLLADLSRFPYLRLVLPENISRN
jgi:hypothetical protein